MDDFLKELGIKTMFEIKDEELEALKEDYMIFMNHVKALEVIDTKDVEPMYYPYEIETSYLREDVETYTISKEEVLNNSKEVKEGMVKVPKVV